MKTFQDYIEIYDGDRYCLMCRHVCPVTRMTKREATSPHGWALLVASVNRGLLKWDADTVDTLYQCSNCGTCEAHCATDRPLPAAIIAARAEVVNQGLAPAGLTDLERALREWGNPYGPVDGRRPVEDSGRRSSLGLFVGDAAAFLRPQSIQATVKLLAAAGSPPTLLGVGRSSGYLPYAVGLWDSASEFAQKTIAEIESGVMTQVVTLSLEDAFALRDVYDLLGLSILRTVRITDLAEFLAERVEQGRLNFDASELKNFAYHDPCHTTRFPQHSGAARRLIGRTLGEAPKDLFWRETRTTPCGAIGGLQFTQPALSEQMARAVVDDARQTGAEVLLVDDAHCAAQLDKFSDGMPVRNLIEVLADSVQV